MRVIGIMGKAGAGKDTVADHLVAKHGFAKGQFACVLKDVVCRVYGWDREALDSDHAARKLGYASALAYKEEVPRLPGGAPQCPGPDSLPLSLRGMTRRKVLQHIGTEGFRYCALDTWVRCEMNRLPGGASGIVFADLRFPNEVDAIRNLGGRVWCVRKIGGPGTASGGHSSETALDGTKVDAFLEAAHGEIPKLLALVDETI